MLKIKKKSWDFLLSDEFEKKYYIELNKELESEYETKEIYPSKEEVFSIFENLDYEKVKVVILGQDPYHGRGEAHGLAFSVKEGMKIPPSLKNIFKELKNEYENFVIPNNGYLMNWVKEGVFLLNATLTVEKDKANSHSNIGWSNFTDRVIELLNEREEPIVFLLWGKFAISKKNLITNKRHLILESVHPSPLSAYRGFFGNNHFIQTNEFLEKNKIASVNWNALND